MLFFGAIAALFFDFADAMMLSSLSCRHC